MPPKRETAAHPPPPKINYSREEAALQLSISSRQLDYAIEHCRYACSTMEPVSLSPTPSLSDTRKRTNPPPSTRDRRICLTDAGIVVTF
jgi:hypothetical protein